MVKGDVVDARSISRLLILLLTCGFVGWYPNVATAEMTEAAKVEAILRGEDLTIDDFLSPEERAESSDGEQALGDALFLDDLIKAGEGEFISSIEKNWQITSIDRISSIKYIPRSERLLVVASREQMLHLCDEHSGDVLWSKQLDGSVTDNPATDGNMIFVGTAAGTVYALAEESGEVIWTHKGNREINLPPVSDGRRIYYGDWGGVLYALDIVSGALVWKYETGEAINSAPLIVGELVLFGSMDNYMYAVNRHSGILAWKFKAGWTTSRLLPMASTSSLYLPSYDSHVYALGMNTGQTLWRFKTDSAGVLLSLQRHHDYLYFSSFDNNLYVLDINTGGLIWKRRFRGRASFDDNSFAGQTMLITLDSGWVYALNVETGAVIWRQNPVRTIKHPVRVLGDTAFVLGGSTLYGYSVEDGQITWQEDADFLENVIFQLLHNRLYFFSDFGMLVQYKRVTTDLDRLAAAGGSWAAERKFKVDLYNTRPRYSKDGRFVVLARGVNKGMGESEDLYRYDLSKGGLVRFTVKAADDWSPIWSADNEHFYYVSNPDGVYSIYKTMAMRTDIIYDGEEPSAAELSKATMPEGSDVDIMKLIKARTPEEVNAIFTTPLVRSAGNDFYPELSPDGRKLAFLSDRRGEQEIWMLDLGRPGSKEYPIVGAKDAAACREITWNASGTQLAFTARGAKSRDLFRYDLASKQVTLLTDTPEDESNPAFSEGAIFFTRRQLGGGSADVWRYEQSRAYRLTPEYSVDLAPRPSPNGTQVAFISNRNGSNNIWIMDRAGKKVVQLTDFEAGAHAWGVEWSPDGSKIAFYYEMDGQKQVGHFEIGANLVLGLLSNAREATLDNNYPLAIELYKMVADNFEPIQTTGVYRETRMQRVNSQIFAAFMEGYITHNFQKEDDSALAIWQRLQELKDPFPAPAEPHFSFKAEAKMLSAEIFLRRRQYELAMDAYEYVILEFPVAFDLNRNDLAPLCAIKTAESNYNLGKYTKALKGYQHLRRSILWQGKSISIAGGEVGVVAPESLLRIAAIERYRNKDHKAAFEAYCQVIAEFSEYVFTKHNQVKKISYGQEAINRIVVYSKEEPGLDWDNWADKLTIIAVSVPDRRIRGELEQAIGLILDRNKIASSGVLSGSRIVFTSRRNAQSLNYEIFTMDINGLGLQQLTFNHENDYQPRWSPDGRKILFHGLVNGSYDICLMEADGSYRRNLTRDEAYDYDPVWAPDGRSIAFVSDRAGNADIYRLPLDGRRPINLTENEAKDHQPRWSPDGSQILFTSNRNGNRSLFLMDTEGANLLQITAADESCSDPAWSKDGASIAFVSYVNGNSDIFVMDLADMQGTLRNVTRDAASDYAPVWADNGATLVFCSERTGNPEIYKLDIQTGLAVNLSNNESYDIQPDVYIAAK